MFVPAPVSHAAQVLKNYKLALRPLIPTTLLYEKSWVWVWV